MCWQERLSARARRWADNLLRLPPRPRNPWLAVPWRFGHLCLYPFRLVALALMGLGVGFVLVEGTCFGALFGLGRGLYNRGVSREAPPKKRPAVGVRRWAGAVLRFVFYLELYSIGLGFAALLLVGVIRLWAVPGAAARQDLQPFDLLARALENRNAAWLIWEPVGRDLGLPCRDAPDRLAAAYPDEADRAAALAWANDFYRRLAVLERRVTYKRGWMEINGDLSDLPPPPTGRLEGLLDGCVGLTPESARAARQRWLGYVAPGREALALGWGRELERERRRAGEPLPPSSDNVALLCVLERLTGLDAYGGRCRQFLSVELGVGRHEPESGPAVPLFYPNDDYFFLAAAADPLRLGWPSWGTLLGTLVFLLAASVGLRLLVFVLLGRVALRLQDDPHFVEYRRHRTRWTAGDLFVSYLLIPLLAWPLAWWTLPVQLQVLTRSPWQVLGGVYASLLLGGTLLVLVSQVVALLLIARGHDLQATWWDEILGLSLGAAVLLHFGNDAVSVASYVAFALLPEILARRRVRRFRDEQRLEEATSLGLQ